MAKSKLPDELMFIENRRAAQKSTDALMTGKVCVVTGATSGVGLEAVKQLARGHAHLVMVCRNPEKAENVRQMVTAQYQVPVDVIESTIGLGSLSVNPSYFRLGLAIRFVF